MVSRSERTAANAAVDPLTLAAYTLLAKAAESGFDWHYVRASVGGAAGRAGSLGRLAAELGVSKSTLSVTMRGATRPHLDLFVRAQVWLSDGTAPLGPSRAHRQPRSPSEGMLRQALRSAPAPSLRALAREAGSTPGTLRSRWPALTRALIARRRGQIARAAALRRTRRQRRVMTALTALARSGLPLRRRALEAALPHRGWLRDPEIRALYDAAVGDGDWL